MSINTIMPLFAVGLTLAASLLYWRSRQHSALLMVAGAALFWVGMAVVAFGPRSPVESTFIRSDAMASIAEIRRPHIVSLQLAGGGAVLYVAGLLWFAAGASRKP